MATSAFGKAFASASKAGKKTFTHGGKSYTTEKAKETPKKGPMPQSRQGADKGSGGRATTAKTATPPASKPAAKPTTKTPSKAPKGPTGAQRNASGSIPYKRDNSVMSKATALIAKVAGRSPAKPASTAKKGGGGGGW